MSLLLIVGEAIIVGKAVNLLLTFVIYLIFFLYSCHVILVLNEVMVEIISFGVRRRFLFMFLLNMS